MGLLRTASTCLPVAFSYLFLSCLPRESLITVSSRLKHAHVMSFIFLLSFEELERNVSRCLTRGSLTPHIRPHAQPQSPELLSQVPMRSNQIPKYQTKLPSIQTKIPSINPTSKAFKPRLKPSFQASNQVSKYQTIRTIHFRIHRWHLFEPSLFSKE